jgi:Protein of unknown function (DUF3618)
VTSDPQLGKLGEARRLPEEIEADIAHTRARLSATIAALERELALQRLIESGAAAILAQARRQVRGNAIPLALIAAGAAWLLLRRLREDRALGRAQAPADPDRIPSSEARRLPRPDLS